MKQFLIMAAIFSLLALTGCSARLPVLRGSTVPPAVQVLPDRNSILEAYQFALQKISIEHIYPDGSDIGFDGALGFIEDNIFSVFDIDGDGMEELVVSITTAPLEKQRVSVYRYDAETGGVILAAHSTPPMRELDGLRMVFSYLTEDAIENIEEVANLRPGEGMA